MTQNTTFGTLFLCHPQQYLKICALLNPKSETADYEMEKVERCILALILQTAEFSE